MVCRTFDLLHLLAIVCVLSSCGRRETGAPGARPAGPPRLLTTGGSLDYSPSFFPDGKSIVTSSDRTGHFEIYVQSLAAGSRAVAVTHDGNENFQPSISPDGTLIAYHSQRRGGIWIVPVTGGTPRPLADFGSDPTWSPDGDLVAFQSQRLQDATATAPVAAPPSTIWVVPARGGPARDVTHQGQPPGGHGSPVFSLDGTRILFVATDSRIATADVWSVTLNSERLDRLLTVPRIFEAVPSPDGYLYYTGTVPGTGFGILRVPLKPASGEPKPEIVVPPGDFVPRHLAISKDGHRLTWSNLQTNGNLWSLPITPEGVAAGPPRPLTGGDLRSTWPVFSRDGKRVAFGRMAPRSQSDVWMVDADGGNLVQLTSDPAQEFVLDWFPSGEKLLFISNKRTEPTIWSLSLADRSETLLDVPAPDMWNPRLSPDGERIVYNSRTGSQTINVWMTNLTTKATRQLTFDREMLGFPCWAPDGRAIAMQVKRGDDMHVVVLPLDAADPEQLTNEKGLSWPFSFSPDSDKVAFAALREMRWSIRWVSRRTREVKEVLREDRLNAYVRYPAWSPRGDMIVYERAETKGNVVLLDLR